MTRHEKKEAMEMASARQAVVGLDEDFREKTIDAIKALDKLDGPHHAMELRMRLYEILSLLETIRDEKVPNAALIEAMEEARTLKGRSRSIEELFHALETEGKK